MHFNNYSEEEIEKNLENLLCKKAYKKEDKAPKKLNVDDDEWLIEDGVVRRYRGHKKNLFVPEGVIRLAPSSLRYKELETIYLPNTLKTMLDFCLADNNLEEIDLPLNLKYIYPGILYGNKITKLKLSKGIKTKWGFEHPLPTSLKELEFYASDFMENFYYIKNTKLRNMNLETIIINFDNKDKISLLGGYYSAYEFLNRTIRDFTGCVNNFVIYNAKISLLEQLKLKLIFNNKNITFKKISPIAERKPSVIYEEKEEKEPEPLELNPSVQIINSILNLLANLDISIRKPILKEIAHIVSNYQSNLKKYEPEVLSLNIILKLEPKSKENLYCELNSSLNDILTSLQNNPVLKIYHQVMSYKIDIKDNQTLDIVEFQEAKKNLSSDTYNILLDNLINYFDSILGECSKELPASFNNKEKDFNYRLEDITANINKYINHAYHYEKIKKQIKGEEQTELSQFLEDIKLIIFTLPLEFKEKNLNNLELVITGILEEAQYLQYDYETLELKIRYRLQEYLEGLKQELEYIKTYILIETFKEAFNILSNKEKSTKENPGYQLIEEIKSLINYPLLDEVAKELYTNLLDNVLEEINKLGKLTASEINEYLLKEGLSNNQSYLNLSLSSKFTIYILNKLYAIYLPLNVGVQELKWLYKNSNDIIRSLK